MEQLSLTLESTVRDAMETLNNVQGMIVFIVDTDKRLRGTITDGDIRRSLLDGVTIHSPVTKIMSTTPTVCVRGVDEHEAQTLMQKNHVQIIPVLDKAGVLIDFHSIDEHRATGEEDTVVVIMASGRGEPLTSLTEDAPRSLLKVGPRPVLETILESFARKGFRKFYFSVNHMADTIKGHFQDGRQWGVHISYLEEHPSLGTVGGLRLIDAPIDRPFILMNGNLLTKVDFHALLAFHRQSKASATVCVREHSIENPYGVVSVNEVYITDIAEKPVQKFIVNAGIHVLAPECLNYIQANAYCDMPSLIKAILADKKRVASFPIHEYWLDIGRLEDLQRAQADYLSDF